MQTHTHLPLYAVFVRADIYALHVGHASAGILQGMLNLGKKYVNNSLNGYLRGV